MKMIWYFIIGIMVIGFIVAGFYFSRQAQELISDSEHKTMEGVSQPIKIAESSSEIVWNIHKTGAEEELEVEYEILSDTQTEFCIKYKNKQEYINKLDKSNDIKQVPISIVGGDLTLDKTQVDLDKDEAELEECFSITYDKLVEGLSLKIGWNSVEIDSTSSISATTPPASENICLTPNGNIYVAYEGANDDLYLANSSDNGTTWSTKLAEATTVEGSGILCHSNNSISVYWYDGNLIVEDLLLKTSSDGGDSWSSTTTVLGHSDSYVDTCTIDENDRWHCIQILTGRAYYRNSTSSQVTINDNINNDIDYCDIVHNGTHPFVVCSGSDQDDLDVWSPGLNGWGDTNRVEMCPGTLSDSSEGISAQIVNDHLYVAWIDSNDLQFANASTNNIGNADCQELDGTTSSRPSLAVNEYGNIELLYAEASGDSDGVSRQNSSNYGLTWTQTDNYYGVTGGNPSVIGNWHPEEGKFTNILHHVYLDGDDDITYNKYEINADLPTGDNEYPKFSNYADNNGTQTGSGTGVFNVTILSTNGTVYLEINSTNYTASVASGSIYTASATLSEFESPYSYQWFAFGNGSENNFNRSGTNRSYTILSTPDTAPPNVTNLQETPDPATYTNGQKLQFNATVYDANLLLVRLQFDGVNYTARNIAGNVYNYTFKGLSVGSYNYRWCGIDSLSNINCSEEGSFTINKATPTGSISGDATEQYPYQSSFTGSESNAGDGGCTYGLFRDNLSVSNPETTTLGIGSYTYVYNTTGCGNYTGAELDRGYLTINQNNSLTLGLSGTSPIANGTAGDFEGTGCPTELTCTLYRDGQSVSNPDTTTLSPATYNYQYNTTGNTNYSATNTSVVQLIVNEAEDTTDPTLTIDSPANNTNSTNTGLDVTYTASDNIGVDSCWYSNDSMTVNNTLAGCVDITSITWSLDAHNVTIWVNDTSGNEVQKSVSFNISEAPTSTNNIRECSTLSVMYDNPSLPALRRPRCTN